MCSWGASGTGLMVDWVHNQTVDLKTWVQTLHLCGSRNLCCCACSCCGRAFASCWACRLCVWKLQQCCCSVLLFKTHWKEVPAIAVCFGSQGLAEVDQTWTQRGPNVDPNETKSRKKLLFYFFVVSPSLSLSLSLSLSRGSILATVGSDSCTFPTKRRPT